MRRSRLQHEHAVVAIAVSVAGAVVLALVLTVHHVRTARTPQTVATLPSVPAMHRGTAACGGQAWAPDVTAGGAGTITVDPDPTVATVFWIPGLNSTTCRVEVTELPAVPAVSLAGAVRAAAPLSGDAVMNCPDDDGSAAWIFFRYAARPALDVIEVDLTGCRLVSAPDRTAVGWNSKAAGILQKLEPADWPHG